MKLALKKPTGMGIREGAKRVLLMILALAMIFNLSACGSSKKQESYEGTLAAGETKIGSENLSLNLGDYPLNQDAQYRIQPVDDPPPLEGVDISAYSFEIDSQEDLFTVMELTIPYDEKALEGKGAKGNIGAAYYNEEAGQWEPVTFTVNEENKTLTIYTDHLSVYGCFEVTNPNTKDAYAAYAIPAFATSSLMSADANAIITSAANNSGSPGQDAVDAGLQVLDVVLNLSSAGVDTAAYAASLMGSGGGAAASSLLGDIGERLGNLGLICSIAQVSSGMYSIYNGNTDAVFPCYANALKTSVGYTAGKMGARLYSLAFLGVLAIEYSINTFAEEALSGRKDIYEKAYSLYYEEGGIKRSARDWASVFIKARETASSTDRYKLRIEGLVDRYANQFWEDETVIAEYQSMAQEHGFTGGGGLNDTIKEEISRDFKIKLYKGILQDAFKLIAQKDSMNAEKALLDELNAIKKELNKTCTLEFYDSTVDEKSPISQYGGGKVAVVLPDAIVDKENWTTVLSESGEGIIQFSLLGFLMAGTPTELEVYEKDAKESDGPANKLKFLLEDVTTKVDVGVEALPLSEVVGLYNGSLTVTDVYVSDTIMERAKTDPLRFDDETLEFVGDCDATMLAAMKDSVGEQVSAKITIDALDDSKDQCTITIVTTDEDGEGESLVFEATYDKGKFVTDEEDNYFSGFIINLTLGAQKANDGKISLSGGYVAYPSEYKNDIKLYMGISALKVD